MDAPVKELEQMRALRVESQQLMDGGKLDEALAKVEEALAVEDRNQKSLILKADILEKQGNTKEAGAIRDIVKHLKQDAWQKKVEAEARGHHEVLGD